MNNIAIILGAGSGTRMKMNKSKLLLEIGGKTVLERSVEAFLGLDFVHEVIVVCREQELDAFSDLLSDGRVSFAIGGDTRQQSVWNATRTIDPEECDYLLIHDGARPLVTEQVIRDTYEKALSEGAAAAGVFVKDTVKVIDSSGFVAHTPDRSRLVAIQTPQIFRFDIYLQAIEKAEHNHMEFTDDCGLVEYLGEKVAVAAGDYSNIKITTKEDLLFAENIVNIRRGQL